MIIVILVGASTLFAMEGVSYAAHRWVMHGPGMRWHRSHHRPPAGRWERNDLFPLCFSLVGIAAFVLAWVLRQPVAWSVASGITAYGMMYLAVHELYIHRRLQLRLPRGTYLEWLREAHRAHHQTGGEPYGMLLPVVRSVAPTSRRDMLVRATTRRARARL